MLSRRTPIVDEIEESIKIDVVPVVPIKFGESTGLAFTVHSVNWSCNVTPSIGSAMIEAEMVVSNDTTRQDATMSLSLPLPDGFTVCRYALEVDGTLTDAMAVTSKKAAEVAYKEQNKGRSVATAKASVCYT